MENQGISWLENVMFRQVIPLEYFTGINLVPPTDIPEIISLSNGVADLAYACVRLFHQYTSYLFLRRLINYILINYISTRCFDRRLAGLAPPLRDIEGLSRPDNITPAELIPNSQLIFCYSKALTYTPEAIA